MQTTTAALLAALVLVAVHAIAPMLHFLRGTPRSIWLSIAGGVSVAYVFVHLLPELARGQEHVREALAGGEGGGEGGGGSPLVLLERHVYLVALAGLATFYGLERMAQRARSRRAGRPVHGGRAGGDEAGHDTTAGAGVFRIHVVAFAAYNALVGYLLVHGERETASTLALFTVAMALHFVVADFGLDEHHRHRYRRVGRWVLAAAVLGGWALGTVTPLPEAAIAVLVAFLAGGIILNVLKEEVPSERESRFWAFALGMAGYAALLLAL